MKKLFVVLVVLLAVGTGAFAADVFASYNAPGDLNVYASAGFWGGFDVLVGVEYIVGEFMLGPMPFDWGVMATGGVEFWAGWVGFGVGAMATLHTGLIWNMDFSVAAGVTAYNNVTAFPVTWAHDAAARYWISKNMALFVHEGWVGFNYWGVGVELKL